MMKINEVEIRKISTKILEKTNASKIISIEVIQNLWSNYGVLYRLKTNSKEHPSVIVKYISPPENFNHPRGWNTNISHSRKMTSYGVESYFYSNYTKRINRKDTSRIPNHIATIKSENQILLVIEDLKLSNINQTRTTLSFQESIICIKWLANFHAEFINESPLGLWPTGTYWHLDTRQEELRNIKDKKIKELAPLIDNKLSNTGFRTLVHGDSKVANFCFSQDLTEIAAVDFQYVGAGVGVKDLAYFMSSIFNANECKKYEDEILNLYFKELKQAICTERHQIDIKHLEAEWRSLYPYAWADLHRFLLGWMPDHWKINKYTQKMFDQVEKELI